MTPAELRAEIASIAAKAQKATPSVKAVRAFCDRLAAAHESLK